MTVPPSIPGMAGTLKTIMRMTDRGAIKMRGVILKLASSVERMTSI